MIFDRSYDNYDLLFLSLDYTVPMHYFSYFENLLSSLLKYYSDLFIIYYIVGYLEI